MTDRSLIADEMESALHRALHHWDGVFYWNVSTPEDGGFVFNLNAYTVYDTNSQEPEILSTWEPMTEHDAWTAIDDLSDMFASDAVSLDKIRTLIYAQPQDEA